MDRVKTGIKGLDDMLGGGLPARRPYVVIGPLGSGKTTLGIQFLLRGLRDEESVLMVALDEPPNEIKENMHSFGWDVSSVRILDATPDVKAYSKTHAIKELASKMDVAALKEVTDIRKSNQQRTMEVSIYSVQQMLKHEMKEYKEVTGNSYSRLVIDSMTALKIFGMKGIDMRTALQSFMRFISELELTALIMVDSSADHDMLETDILLSRGEIVMHKWHHGDEMVRAISIDKMRGANHDLHMRPLKIGDSGISVDSEGTIQVEDDDEIIEIVHIPAAAGEDGAAAAAGALDSSGTIKKIIRRKAPAKKPRAKKAGAKKRSRDSLLAEKHYKDSRTL